MAIIEKSIHDTSLFPRLVLGAVRCIPNYLLEEKVSGVPPVFQGREEFQPWPILVGMKMENGRRGEHEKESMKKRDR